MVTEATSIEEKWDDAINEALSLYRIDDNIQVGILTLEPETRLPEDSYSVHENSHEFSYVLEGEMTIVRKDGKTKISEGELMYNPPGTEHYTYNYTSKRAKAIWFLTPPLD